MGCKPEGETWVCIPVIGEPEEMRESSKQWLWWPKKRGGKWPRRCFLSSFLRAWPFFYLTLVLLFVSRWDEEMITSRVDYIIRHILSFFYTERHSTYGTLSSGSKELV